MKTLVHFDQMRPEIWCISSHYGFHGLLGNANRRKMTDALAIILQKINWETKRKTFWGPYFHLFEGIWTIIWGWQICLMWKQARFVWSENGPKWQIGDRITFEAFSCASYLFFYNRLQWITFFGSRGMSIRIKFKGFVHVKSLLARGKTI